MKRIGLIMLFIAVLFSGCGSNTPKDVVVEYTETIADEDTKEMDAIKPYLMPALFENQLYRASFFKRRRGEALKYYYKQYSKKFGTNFINDINLENTKKVYSPWYSYEYELEFNTKDLRELIKVYKTMPSDAELEKFVEANNEEIFLSDHFEIDKINILKENIEADTATVKIEVIIKGESMKLNYSLETIDGEWKIKSID